MKVKQLVELLSKLDQNIDILCYTEDAGLLENGDLFRLLDIHEVSSSKAIIRRREDGVVSAKFDNRIDSQKCVFIHITTDF